MPDVAVRRVGEPMHRGAVRLGGASGEVELVVLVVPVVTRGDREAGGEALHAPLLRPLKGLVEVVEIEHEAPLR
jgi:hypothetical protein